MARTGFSVEKLLEIVAENTDAGVQVLFGAGAPLGTSGETDDAPIGSLYLDSTNGHKYMKDTDSSSASDWILEGKLSSAYSLPANALPSAGIEFETAIGLLDANQQDLVTLSGEANGAVDHGTFTGNIIQDNQDTHDALQDLETAIELIAEDNSADGVTTITVLDSELCDDFNRCEWIVTAYMVDDRARQQSFRISASHNGHSGADATATDSSVDAKHKFGANFNVVASITLSGSGASQAMNLNFTSSETNGIDVRTRKLGCTKSQG